MATYYYDIPVIVIHAGDEGDEELPVKMSVVMDVVANFNQEVLEQYSRSVEIDRLRASPVGRKIRVRADTTGGYSVDTEEAIRKFLSGQCSDGWGENGFEMSGYSHGYSQRYIIVYVWDKHRDVVIVNGHNHEQ